MAEQRPTSAAAALYPNLPSGTPDLVERRTGRNGTVAGAMFPNLVVKPKSPNPYLEPMTEQAWRDHLMGLAGLRRKR